MEFMVIFTLFLVALGVAVYASVDKTRSITETKIGLDANSMVSRVTSEVNSVYLQGDGFSTRMTLPRDILNLNYTSRFQSNQFLLEVGNRLYIGSTLTNNITGNLTTGENTIRNQGGVVVING